MKNFSVKKSIYTFSIICFWIFNSNPLNALNIDSLKSQLTKAKEDTNKVNLLLNICQQQGTISDSERFEHSENAIKLSQKLNYRIGKAKALLAQSSCLYATGKYDRALEELSEALKISTEEIKNNELTSDVYNNIANVYYYKSDYVKALKYYFKSLALIDKGGEKRKIASTEFNIATVYLQNKAFGKSIDYSLRANYVFEQLKDTVSISNVLANLGNVSYGQNSYTQALNYYSQALKLSEKFKDKSYSLIDLVGIGSTYGAEKKYPESIIYFKKALAIGREINDQQNIAVCLLNLGEAYIEEKNYESGIDFLKQAAVLSEQIGIKIYTKEVYNNLSNVYEKQNNFKDALRYHQLYSALNDSIFNEENSQQINELSAKYESEKKEKEIAVLKLEQTITETQNKRKKFIYVSIIIMIIMMAFFLLNRQRLKSKKDKIIFEKQEALLAAEKQKTEDELLHAKKLLDNYTENLIDKNKAIEDLIYENEKLKGLKAVELYKEKMDNLDDLNNATILTNEDWEKFKDLFEQVYKGFFIRLKDKFPNLTNAETRLISLIKLNLDTKQMANMLGVSPNTITMTKYRLRKKINLSEKQDVDLLIGSI